MLKHALHVLVIMIGDYFLSELDTSQQNPMQIEPVYHRCINPSVDMNCRNAESGNHRDIDIPLLSVFLENQVFI